MSAKIFVVEKYLLCRENFFGMSGKFCRMFVDMCGKFFLVCPKKLFWFPPSSPTIWGEILMFSLPVRANYTVPLQTRLGPYAHASSGTNFAQKVEVLLEFFR